MAFSSNEKLSKANKLPLQLFDSAAEGSTGGKYWYNELFSWQPILSPNKIWNEIENVPGAGNQTEADAAVSSRPDLLEKIKVRLTLDLTSNNRTYVAREIFNDNTSDVVGDWVLPALIRNNGAPSTGYNIRFYNGDPDSGGTEITTTYHSGTGGAPSWEFNYSLGLIKISEDESSHYRTLYDSNGLWIQGYRYIGETGGTGASSTGNFEDTLYDILYRYISLTGDDDTADGTVSNPFQTLEKAVESLPLAPINSVHFRFMDGVHFIDKPLNEYISKRPFITKVVIDSYSADRWNTIDTGVMSNNYYFKQRDSTKSWTVDEHRGRFLHWIDHPTDSSNAYYPIIGNTSDTLTISGNPELSVLLINQYEIVEHGVTVQRVNAYDPIILHNKNIDWIYIDYIKIKGHIQNDIEDLDISGYQSHFYLESHPTHPNEHPSLGNSSIGQCYLEVNYDNDEVIETKVINYCGIVTDSSIMITSVCHNNAVTSRDGNQQPKPAFICSPFSKWRMTIGLAQIYVDNFQYIIGFDSDSYSTIFYTILSGELVHENVDFIVYGNPGFQVFDIPNFPIVSIDDTGLVGRMTLDGINEATYYLDVENGINALLIAPDGKDRAVIYNDDDQGNIKIFDCNSSASIGDVVKISTTNNYVEVCNDNRSDEISIGVIIEKPTSITCKVLMRGKVDTAFAGLQVGKKVFLGLSGSLTTSVPTTGYIQCLGFCPESDTIFLNPSVERVKRNPF